MLYFLFLNPVLNEVQQVNKLFEAKSVDKVKLLNEFILLITSIGKKVVLPTSNIDILTIKVDDFLNPKPYLGYQFETKVAEWKSQGTLINTEENDIQIRCSNFLIALIKQRKQRLSGNIKILKDMSYFSVNYMFQPVKDASAISKVMKFLGIDEDTISKADYQLQKINLVDRVNNMNTEKFWSEVGHYKDASGSNPFLELYRCAISVLILPHSNAEIERVFSCMNYVKSKLRNSMS